ncbi:MAG: xanthine dehydrogenase family protein molybdopterin-binding subunit, partial [Variovorax sp.]
MSALMLPASLQANPRLSTWLRIAPEGHVVVSSGKVELGQGILGALSQIVAEEMGLHTGQVRMTGAVTGSSPDEAVTSGSLSVQHSGAALRHACAQARAIYLHHAATRFSVDGATLHVAGGEIFLRERRLSSYWELADPALLDID